MGEQYVGCSIELRTLIMHASMGSAGVMLSRSARQWFCWKLINVGVFFTFSPQGSILRNIILRRATGMVLNRPVQSHRETKSIEDISGGFRFSTFSLYVWKQHVAVWPWFQWMAVLDVYFHDGIEALRCNNYGKEGRLRCMLTTLKLTISMEFFIELNHHNDLFSHCRLNQIASEQSTFLCDKSSLNMWLYHELWYNLLFRSVDTNVSIVQIRSIFINIFISFFNGIVYEYKVFINISLCA